MKRFMRFKISFDVALFEFDLSTAVDGQNVSNS